MQCNSFFEINSGLDPPPPRLLGPPTLIKSWDQAVTPPRLL